MLLKLYLLVMLVLVRLKSCDGSFMMKCGLLWMVMKFLWVLLNYCWIFRDWMLL